MRNENVENAQQHTLCPLVYTLSVENCINRQCCCQCNWFFSFRNVHISCVPDILYIWRAFSTFGCSDKVMQQKSGWSLGYYLCILKCHTNKSLGYPQVLQRSCTIFDNNNNSYYESCEWLLGFCLLPWIFQFSGSVRNNFITIVWMMMQYLIYSSQCVRKCFLEMMNF